VDYHSSSFNSNLALARGWARVLSVGCCAISLSHLAFASAYLVGRAVTVIVVRVIKSILVPKNRHDTVKTTVNTTKKV